MSLVCRAIVRSLALILSALFACQDIDAYSVLSHEAVVDALWEVRIKSLLVAQFPNATAEELKRAHGYAYGGAILQDLGYYPHGSKQFSDLTHYVRTGDFILALMAESHDMNEISFALGALSHQVADLDGHRFATNVAEPILYPKTEKRFGHVVTYEDNPALHLKTEFAFDVLEVAKGNFAPQSYHDFIGFFVSKELIARAFRDTYGLELSDLFGNFDEAIASYRSAVSRTIPTATRIAWAQKRSEIQKAEPGISRKRFVYIMKRSSYERDWGKRRDEPTLGDKFLAFLLRLIPPMGPLNDLKFKMLTPQVERLFEESFSRVIHQYEGKLDALAARNLVLANENYAVGTVTPAGQYFMEDTIQAFWLHKLAENQFKSITPAIRTELSGYFGSLNAPTKIRTHPKAWKQLQIDYATLQAIHP